MSNPYRDVASKVYITVCMQCNSLSIFKNAENECCNKLDNLKIYKVFNDETEAKNYLKGILV